MIIAGLTVGKHASVCLLNDGVIEFFIEEERLSRKKLDNSPFLCLLELKKHTAKVDYLAISESSVDKDAFVVFAKKIGLIDKDSQVLTNTPNETHHVFHAASAFYTSGFESAVCVVIDNAGSWISLNPQIVGSEVESIYQFSYPANYNLLYKKVINNTNNNPVNIGPYEISSEYGIGKLYACVTNELKFGKDGAGKVMGLSSYGKPDDTIPDIFVKINGRDTPNKNLFICKHDESFLNKFPFVTTPILTETEYSKENLCYAVQKATESVALSHVLKAVELSGSKNVVISGGYGLNCVANYEFLKHLPSDINVYIDPVAYDGGQSIGIAKYFYHKISKSSQILKQETYYLGPKPTYDFKLNHNETIQDATYSDIIDLIVKQNIVAMFQGSCEAGPRALGNRSILFDPRNPNGKDIVNSVKQRESFRPFAGTVLKEFASEWFDMRGLKESPFMSFAVNVIEEMADKIPSIVHVDKSCRIQTVTKEQNEHYYNLISEFNRLTNVPMLFNTSFNLAGDPLVETVQDALETLRKSKIEFLYLPEKQKLITIKN